MYEMPEDPGPVIVESKTRGRITVSGQVAAIILYLAEHASFFNDARTLGNFVILAKDGHLALKSDTGMNTG